MYENEIDRFCWTTFEQRESERERNVKMLTFAFGLCFFSFIHKCTRQKSQLRKCRMGEKEEGRLKNARTQIFRFSRFLHVFSALYSVVCFFGVFFFVHYHHLFGSLFTIGLVLFLMIVAIYLIAAIINSGGFGLVCVKLRDLITTIAAVAFHSIDILYWAAAAAPGPAAQAIYGAFSSFQFQ